MVYDEQAYCARIRNWHNASWSDSKKSGDNLSSFSLVIGQEIANTQDDRNINVAAQTETVYEGQMSYDSSDA
ncbi:3-methylcrotonyl-CoA carboxylase, partial [Psychrobacter proteolyticus]